MLRSWEATTGGGGGLGEDQVEAKLAEAAALGRGERGPVLAERSVAHGGRRLELRLGGGAVLEDVTTRGEGVRGATELEEGRLARRAVLRKRQAERRLLHRGHRAGEVHRDGAATRGDVKGRGPIAARKRRAEEIDARRRTAHARSHDRSARRRADIARRRRRDVECARERAHERRPITFTRAPRPPLRGAPALRRRYLMRASRHFHEGRMPRRAVAQRPPVNDVRGEEESR